MKFSVQPDIAKIAEYYHSLDSDEKKAFMAIIGNLVKLKETKDDRTEETQTDN